MATIQPYPATPVVWIDVVEQGQLATSTSGPEEKTATRVFVARAAVPTTTVAAETADGLPSLGTGHPDDLTRTLRSKTAKPDPAGGRRVFTVELTYSNKGGEQPDVNPLSRPAEVSWDFDDGTEPYFLDRSEEPKPVVNSVKERFAELLERDTGSLVATITKNIPANAYSPSDAIAMKNAVNEGGISVDGISIDAGQAKCKGWTAGPRLFENGVAYRVSKVVLQFRESWDHVVEDRGFNEKDGSTGKVKQIVKGTPPTKPETPWPLDGAGVAKANIADAPAQLTFQPYFKRAFSLPLA